MIKKPNKKNQADGKKRHKFCKKTQNLPPFLPPLILALAFNPVKVLVIHFLINNLKSD